MKPQRWAAWIAAAVCLPLLALPWLIAECPPDRGTEAMVWAYPFVIVAAAYCAYRSMPSRPEVFWILVAIILLTHAAMWVLVNPTYLTLILR